MKRARIAGAGAIGMMVGGLLLGLTLPGAAWAHHSFAVFDRTKTTVVTIKVTDWKYVNPHSWLDGVDKNGQAWAFECPDTVILSRLGIKKSGIKAGHTLIITAFPLRDGRKGGFMAAVKLPDGRAIDVYPRTPADKAKDPPVDADL